MSRLGLIGRRGDVTTLDGVLALTSERRPELVPWVAAHPMEVLDVATQWDRMLDVVEWVDGHDTTRLYLRHLDLPGVDTKFVERHRKLLGGLLGVVLRPERVDLASKRFDVRFGFKSVPVYLRFRVLSRVEELPASLSELSVRAAELARLELSVRTVFVVENQATYLAFPDVAESIVVFGEGFKASTLEAVPWLADRELVYWGDIDTHGFHILDQLRARFPEVASLLMDEATLTAHLARVVSEDKVPADVVRMGSTVTFRSDAGGDGETHERTETLVYPVDEDSDAHKLSVMTPVGAALIGLAVGQSISWTARDGRKHRLTVVKVS